MCVDTPEPTNLARKLYQKLIIIPVSRQPNSPIPPTLRQSTSSYSWTTFDLQAGLGLESIELEDEDEEEEEEEDFISIEDVCDNGDGRLCGS
jgi:hypothetical protein